MPKILRYRRLFLLLYFIPFVLFAQSIPLKTDILPEKNAKNSFRLKLQFQINPQLSNEIALHFSTKEQVFPEKIFVAGKSLWLRHAQTKPQLNNVVHWFYADSVLELRFNTQTLKSGTNLILDLHVSELQPIKNNLSVVLTNLNTGVVKNSVLTKTNIPLPKNPQN